MGAKAKNNCQLVGGGRKKEREGERETQRELLGLAHKMRRKIFCQKNANKNGENREMRGRSWWYWGVCVCVCVCGWAIITQHYLWKSGNWMPAKMKKHIELFSDSGKSREHKCWSSNKVATLPGKTFHTCTSHIVCVCVFVKRNMYDAFSVIWGSSNKHGVINRNSLSSFSLFLFLLLLLLTSFSCSVSVN